MTERNLSMPGNPRYQPRALQEIFGYDNLFRPLGEVELAVLDELAERGIIPATDHALLTPEIREQILDIKTSDVDRVERETTGHDVRAWVRLAQQILPEPLRRWLHVPLTSYDGLDTARALQFSRAHVALRSQSAEVIRILALRVEEHAETLQIGRTHGQAALPITVGFWLATILSRVMKNAREMDRFAEGLVGKISGAVGAYNAQSSLGIDRDGTFETNVLKRLGLAPAAISTQILPPEPLAYYLFSVVAMQAVFAQLGRDCRHLMRTEISEVIERFESGQVGSSTMAGKRNPITFENLEGMYHKSVAEFGKVWPTLVSEHQRDLVGSSIMRDLPIIVINLAQQLQTLLRKGKKDDKPFLAAIGIDVEACQRNFDRHSKVTLAEPLYIALQMAGYEGDAHELVNHTIVPAAARSGEQLFEETLKLGLTEGWEKLGEACSRIPQEVWDLLSRPDRYTGRAAEKARQIAVEAREF